MQQEIEAINVEVSEEFHGWRMDSYLASQISNFSRTRIKSLIKNDLVSLNGEIIDDPNHRVNKGECVRLKMVDVEEYEPEPEDIPLKIVHEDSDLIVVDKPAGMVVHPAAGNWTGTLVNALLHHCGQSLSGINGVRRPGIVHRLDKGTTGLLVVAKNDLAHESLAAQFSDHGRSGPLKRTYKTLVWGAPDSRSGRIDANLSRSAANRQKIAVVKSGGRQAITHWKLLERFGPVARNPYASLIQCNLETGRTHQIRVHLAHTGMPVIGDSVYGAHFTSKANLLPENAKRTVEGLDRPALHAEFLAFKHPRTNELMEFQCPLPEDFQAVLAALQTIKHVPNAR